MAIKAPKGLQLLEKDVIGDGPVSTVTKRGRTVEEVVSTILRELPAGCIIVGKRVLEQPRVRTIVHKADPRLSEETVRSSLPSLLGIDADVEEISSLVLARPGRRGLLGIIGYRHAEYNVEIISKGLFEIQFYEKALIRATFGDADSLVALLESDETKTAECLDSLNRIDPKRAKEEALRIMRMRRSVWSVKQRATLSRLGVETASNSFHLRM